MSDTGQGPEVLVERRDDVGVITLNRPASRNAIGWTLSRSILDALDEVEAVRGLSVVLLAGAGKTFCAGAKMGEILVADGGDEQRRDAANRDFVEVVRRLRRLQLPVVCALNGVAVGGGVALAMACDMVVAEEDAAYLFAFGRVGATAADAGCTYLLPRMIGLARARRILLTGGRVDAAEGKELGLFAEIAPKGQLGDVAFTLARQVAGAGPRDVATANKQILLHAETSDFETMLAYENHLQTRFLNTEESRRRVRDLLDQLKK